MRGRKPTPVGLKILRGNPGHRPIKADAVMGAPLDLAPPPDLESEALMEWQRLAPGLVTSGVAQATDRAVLAIYCRLWGEWLELERLAKAHPKIIKSPSGYPIPNPARGMANRVVGLLLKAAAELGMSPTARARVAATQENNKTSFEVFSAKKPKIRRVI